MSGTGKWNSDRGFTMVEAVVVVLLLAIVMAIAVPAVGAIQNNLYIAEMDAYARQIFLAAQNELSAMKASGALVRFHDDIAGTEGTAAAADCTELGVRPEDYPENDSSWIGLYAVPDQLLVRAKDSVDDATEAGQAASAYVELNPVSGSVYSVFYAESDFTYSDALPRFLENRKQSAPWLGYYSGGPVAALPAAEENVEVVPELAILNGEELVVAISTSAPPAAQIDLAITAEGVSSGGKKTWTIQRAGDEEYLILDSLTGDSFAELTADAEKAFFPGENLKITVEVTGTTANGTVVSGSNDPQMVNSLFAHRDDGTGNLTVSHLRHLNNLRAGVYHSGFCDAQSAVTITQRENIDFDFADWQYGVDYLTLTEGLDSFAPIQNDDLFANSTYDGKTLSDFIISGTGEAGLFARLTGSRVEDVRMENCRVSGGNNVGMLVGTAADTEIVNCGAYLTYQADDMSGWLEERSVRGADNTGGLVGNMTNGSVSDSFAAVYVFGASRTGGLAGSVTGGTVSSVYASGDVSASGSCAGGLVGYGSGASIRDCYSTSDVIADNYVGGILGGFGDVGATSSITNGISYGAVNSGESNVGPISGDEALADAAINCKFLQQEGYGFETGVGVPQAYYLLKSSVINGEGTSMPYSAELQGNYFPFSLIETTTGGRLAHYGDWPQEFALQTISMVYYEKYSDGSYGYYADAYLQMLGDPDGSSDSTWTTDSLRYGDDVYCVEDGYALLSTEELAGYYYKLRPDADDRNAVEWGSTMGTLHDSLPDDIRLNFAEDEVGTLVESGAVTEYDSLLQNDNASLLFDDPNSNAYYTLNGAWVYRLPFDLQITERLEAESFWAEMILTAYCREADGSSSLFLNGLTDGAVYYYCPDFAKNAVNPNPEEKDLVEAELAPPADPYGEEHQVYVRSARQLNGLGRSTFYWNTEGGGGQIHFVQEIDIDYLEYVTEYCGVRYDLMDTDLPGDATPVNPYRNKPIGRADSDGDVGNFRNSYDGRGNRIRDYCQATYLETVQLANGMTTTTGQFAGLFGEMTGGTLKNIVMEASGRIVESGRGDSEAYVRSYYNGSNHIIGVGALVGLAYVNYYTSTTIPIPLVSNCAVYGYEIAFDGGSRDTGVGGLVGLCHGNIENSTAVSCIISAEGYGGNDCYVGGLVGSLDGAGTITNCYAGMIDFIDGDITGEAEIGGLCGGLLYIRGGNNHPTDPVISESYTFWENGTSPEYPVVKVLNGARYTNWGQTYQAAITVDDCYYLQDPQVLQQQIAGTTSRTNAQMRGNPQAVESYPVSSELEDLDYPFPAVVTDADEQDEQYVHYGDWPQSTPAFVYYEKSIVRDAAGTAVSWNFYYLNGEGDPAGALTTEGIIDMTGYGILYDGSSVLFNGSEMVLNSTPAGAPSDLHVLTDAQLEELSSDTGLKKVTLSKEGGEEQTMYVNTRYGASIFADESTGGTTEAHPFQIRTHDQLRAIGRFAGEKAYFSQTYDVSALTLTSEENAILPDEFNWIYDGNRNTITALSKPLFAKNTGIMREIALVSANIDVQSGAAALVLDNQGEIWLCSASGRVASAGDAAGLVLNNGGIIAQSYANCQVSGSSAAAMVWSQTAGASVEDCYAGSAHYQEGDFPGYITGVTAASGFIGINGGAVTDCYTVAAVEPGLAAQNSAVLYGFGPDGAGYTNCHWLLDADAGINAALSGGAGAQKTIREMQTVFSAGWTAPVNSYPVHADLAGRQYPYPGIEGMDHYGDWPSGSQSGKLGVAVLYRSGNNYNNYTYYADGQVIERADTAVTGFDGEGSRRNTVLVLYENGSITPDDWTISYRRQGANWIEISRDDEQSLSNAAGYQAFTINVGDNLQNNLRVRLYCEATGEGYVFRYNNNTFTYEGTDA